MCKKIFIVKNRYIFCCSVHYQICIKTAVDCTKSKNCVSCYLTTTLFKLINVSKSKKIFFDFFGTFSLQLHYFFVSKRFRIFEKAIITCCWEMLQFYEYFETFWCDVKYLRNFFRFFDFSTCSDSLYDYVSTIIEQSVLKPKIFSLFSKNLN